MTYDVSTWTTTDAQKPVESKQFKGSTAKDDAERYAERQRERIHARGWVHVVTVSAQP